VSDPLQLAFLIAATPAVVRAALRAAWLVRRHPLPEALERLRDVAPFRAPGLCRPERLLRAADRLARWLPPYDHGLCLRRSFVLVDLWTRCGHRPTVHFGLRPRDEGGADVRGHVWVTLDPNLPDSTPRGGCREIFVT